MRWNPHFVAFAMAHGWTPDEGMRRLKLREIRPSDGFAWIGSMRAEWQRERGIPRDRTLTETQLADFTGWIRGRAWAIREVLDHKPHNGHNHRPSEA